MPGPPAPRESPGSLAVRAFFGVLAALLVAWMTRKSALPGSTVAAVLPGPTGNLVHVLAHGLLATLLLRSLVPWRGFEPVAWPGLGTSLGRGVLGVVLLHGVVDEVHQFFVPGRTCSVFDLVLDGLGGAIVLLAPWPAGEGRPARWTPCVAAAVAAVLLAVAGWLARPFPDTALEDLLLFLGFLRG